MNRLAAILMAACGTLAVFADPPLPGDGSASLSPTMIRDIPYAPELGPRGLGDLFLPANWNADTPVCLQIHGGGWNHGDRFSWEGVARFFADSLGIASFNIEYRLCDKDAPWPACGDDCIAAARFLLSDAFAERYSLRPARLWICGGSAGGHLALWTGLSLPPENVAGIISISGIADIEPDFKAHPGRYSPLFGHVPSPEERRAASPLALLREGSVPRILQTHTTGDTVVPLASARNFHGAAVDLGAPAEFFEYPTDIAPSLRGHYIWIAPETSPHRLLAPLEKRIAQFVAKE